MECSIWEHVLFFQRKYWCYILYLNVHRCIHASVSFNHEICKGFQNPSEDPLPLLCLQKNNYCLYSFTKQQLSGKSWKNPEFIYKGSSIYYVFMYYMYCVYTEKRYSQVCLITCLYCIAWYYLMQWSPVPGWSWSMYRSYTKHIGLNHRCVEPIYLIYI